MSPALTLSSNDRTDIAILKNDIIHINEEITEIKEDIKIIKGYFVKTAIGIGSVVGLYFLQWVLSGGLSHMVTSPPV